MGKEVALSEYFSSLREHLLGLLPKILRFLEHLIFLELGQIPKVPGFPLKGIGLTLNFIRFLSSLKALAPLHQ